MAEEAPIIEARDLSKTYTRGNQSIEVLNGIDLEVEPGSYVSLMGPSGSGKSTLLYLMAGLDRPTSGSMSVAGEELTNMSDSDLEDFRARNIGFIFQAYNLIPVLSAVENVELPLALTDLERDERRDRAETALRTVGLANRMENLPGQLSGGQEQRVAIARAIVSDPNILVADEPTGDLDRKSADEILDLFGKLNEEFGKTIVMVTHDPQAAERAKIRRRLNKGKLE